MKRIIFLILIINSHLISQTNVDSLSWVKSNIRRNQINSNFYKQFSTYNLNSMFYLKHGFENFQFNVEEKFLSTIIKNQNYRNIKDENFFTLAGTYSFLDNLDFGLNVNSKSYTGDKNIALSNSKSSNLILYSIYKPESRIELIPFAGYASNSLVGLSDKGYIYGSELLSKQIDFENIILNGSMKFRNEDILPRRNTDRFINASLENFFENNFRNVLSANISEVRKDLYFDTDSITASKFDIQKNIQNRTEKKSLFGEELEFKPVNSPISLLLTGNISNRIIDRKTRYQIPENMRESDFDYKIEELKIDINSAINYASTSMDGFIRINYSEKEEKYKAKFVEGSNVILFNKRQSIESQKNNKSKLTTLTGAVNYRISKNDVVTSSIFHRKLVYDTQSDLNFDDRDELLSLVQLKYQRQMNYLWNLNLGLEGSLNKIVYIFSERSSNNNVTRVIKLFSGVNYSGAKVKSINYAEVSANYTVYDFEDLNPNYKSFSFRQFVYRDSSTAQVARKIFLKFFGYLKLSEQAELNWDKFSSRPFRKIKEEFYEPKIELRKSGVSLACGIRFYALTNYRFMEKLKEDIDNYYSSIGPIAEVNINLEKVTLRTNGYYEFISNGSNNRKEQVNLQFLINWNF